MQRIALEELLLTDAVQVVAFCVAIVTVSDCPTVIVETDDVTLTVGAAGLFAVVAAELELPMLQPVSRVAIPRRTEVQAVVRQFMQPHSFLGSVPE